MSIRLIALFCAAALAACSSTHQDRKSDSVNGFQQPDSPVARVRLEGRVQNIKYQRGVALVQNLERIAAYGPAAIPVCLNGLKSDDPMTRMGCAYVLGRIGDIKTIPELRQLLKDKVDYVRYEAASSLGGMGCRDGYGVLIDGLEDSHIEYRFKCIQALHDFTGHKFGYSHNAAPAVRKVAVKKWRDWYKKLKAENL